MPKTITVTVTKTVQTAQYEPVTVTVTEVREVSSEKDSEETHLKMYTGVTKSVKKFIDNELAKYATVAAKEKKRSRE